MLRLKKPCTSRISNRLAGFAALLLVITSLAGVGNQVFDSNNAHGDRLANAETVEPKQTALASGNPSSSKKTKRFKVSFFLFRNR